MTDEVQEAARRAARYLAVLWPLPCADAWEESPEHVHTSTLAAIGAGLEAAVSLDHRLADEPEITTARAAIGDRLSTDGGAFTKWSGSTAVDASLLWMAAPYELLVPTEPRFAATLSRIESELISADGGVHRYRADTFYGGGAWPLLTAAYGRVLLRRGGDQGRRAGTGRLALDRAAGRRAGPAARAGRRSRLRPPTHRGVA